MSLKSYTSKAGVVQIKPKMLSPLHAASYLGISRSLLYVYLDISGGPIPSKELRQPGNQRGKRLVSIEALDKFIDGLDGKAGDAAKN